MVLRTTKPSFEREKILRGRAGIRLNTRGYHSYLLQPEGKDRVETGGVEYVSFSKKHLDVRGGGGKSKAKLILEFLKKNSNQAFFSTDIVKRLSSREVRVSDIMANARRWEHQGLVYIRGYRQDDRQTPFKEGYLLTWINQDEDRDEALKGAIERTSKALKNQSPTSPIIHRVHRIRDMIVEATTVRDLVSFDYLERKLECSDDQAEEAVRRALQLYQDIRELKLFSKYRYFYHSSIPEAELKAAVEMKENYVRQTKGRSNRIGHNWEGCVEWFVDKFTTGAKFWSQAHRTDGMDPQRITVHLIRSVGDRKQNAELDRVWEVSPGPLLEPNTYVLECKWGLVSKRDVDDFFNVLRWSKEFGVDTPDGRQAKQGVKGVFAGTAFNPKENVRLKDDKIISLAEYGARMNVQLLKAADLNQRIRHRGVPKDVSVQEICRMGRDEGQVRELLDRVWDDPKSAPELIAKASTSNTDIFEFEKYMAASR